MNNNPHQNYEFVFVVMFIRTWLYAESEYWCTSPDVVRAVPLNISHLFSTRVVMVTVYSSVVEELNVF